jgi:hypothetical protein
MPAKAAIDSRAVEPVHGAVKRAVGAC